MTTNQEKYPISDLVRNQRRTLDMNQEHLAKAIDKTRFWVIDLEKGISRRTGEPFTVDPMMCMKLAEALNLDPVEVLSAAKVPESEWPNFSKIISQSDYVKHVDITRLTVRQQDLVINLVNEFKELNLNTPYEK
ncbi:helix-turn-helix domain-containing protein [Corynebacterium glutamicum]|uniref:helix-turn-helix domain-containing protein n=1 Tax=Corynebacterium glutamicum TaxID=1718 RepID=UPI00058A5F8C|nr:helix-turn-helix transcriptional regulator [Corynebacterium glutamicum]AJE68251.1 hypothetical protein SB89_12360 [Corynebacterium glutamicum]OKX89594.1 hypothetical protein AUP72_10935 [Corynebacterium glutamicum]TWS40991.1 hypothetical protein AKJ21_01750 [Corynebacterium glutamicum]